MSDRLVKACEHELRDETDIGRRIYVNMTPESAMMLVSLVQLATRHPHLGPCHRRFAGRFTAGIASQFEGMPSSQAMIALGNQPEADTAVDLGYVREEGS